MSNISVIIPSFNREYSIERAIQSVLNQTLLPDEIIVVDDGSTDDTAKIIREKYASVKYIYQKNAGVSSARNNGIRNSNSEWLAFLDSDDEWLPTKLEKQMNAFQENVKYSENLDSSIFNRVCHTNEIWVRDGKRLNQKKKHQKYGGFIFQKCLPLCAMSPSTIIIHRAVFQKVGQFDEALPACEDYDLWLRICSKFPVVYLNEPLIIKYGGHKDQLSSIIWGLDRFRIQALEKILKNGNLSEENYNAALAMLLEKLRIFIQGAEKRSNLESVVKYRKKLAFFKAQHTD